MMLDYAPMHSIFSKNLSAFNQLFESIYGLKDLPISTLLAKAGSLCAYKIDVACEGYSFLLICDSVTPQVALFMDSPWQDSDKKDESFESIFNYRLSLFKKAKSFQELSLNGAVLSFPAHSKAILEHADDSLSTLTLKMIEAQQQNNRVKASEYHNVMLSRNLRNFTICGSSFIMRCILSMLETAYASKLDLVANALLEVHQDQLRFVDKLTNDSSPLFECLTPNLVYRRLAAIEEILCKACFILTRFKNVSCFLLRVTRSSPFRALRR